MNEDFKNWHRSYLPNHITNAQTVHYCIRILRRLSKNKLTLILQVCAYQALDVQIYHLANKGLIYNLHSKISTFFLRDVCIWESETEKRDLPSAGLLSQQLQSPEKQRDEARSCIRVSPEIEANTLSYTPLLFPSHQQRAGLELEQLGHSLHQYGTQAPQVAAIYTTLWQQQPIVTPKKQDYY